MLRGFFEIEHNIRQAVLQEYDLARKHYDEVCSYRNVFNRDHAERFRAARDRLNLANELMWRQGNR